MSKLGGMIQLGLLWVVMHQIVAGINLEERYDDNLSLHWIRCSLG